MRIKVLFNKEALHADLRTGWGVSFLIDDKILFDTGENGEWLLENMRLLKVDRDAIEAVVISHDHWDHWGGLWDLLERRKGMRVHICPGFGRGFKDKAGRLGAELVASEGPASIAPGVFTTGEVRGAYRALSIAEQAAALKTENGVSVLTGCAHPGVVAMVERAREHLAGEPLYLVGGGFHLMSSTRPSIEKVAGRFREMGVRKAGPTHCSGDAAEEVFRKAYGRDFVSLKVAEVLEV